MKINNIPSYNICSVPASEKQLKPNYTAANDTVSFSSKQRKQNVSFFKKIKDFFKPDKKIYYASVTKGFEEHFFTKKNSVVSEIALTDAQKKLLMRKIQDFESYKSTLSTPKLEALEKNKHGLLDFSIIDGNPDTELKGYKTFLSRYESFKQGDFTGITNEELSQILYYTDITDLISDGKIGSFGQGRTGDCWLLSMLGNYASTPQGEANIAKRISKPDANGNYTVTFDDFFDSSKKQKYTVTAKDLQDYDLLNINSMFSSGDLDVRILEIAVGKMLNKHLLPLDKFSSCKENSDNYIFSSFSFEPIEYSPSSCIAAGYPEKELIVHRALGYKSDVIRYIKKNDSDDFNILTSYSNKEYLERTNADIFSLKLKLSNENGKLKFTPVVEPTEYKSFAEVINKNGYNASNIVANSSDTDSFPDEKGKRYISMGHAFNVMQLDENDSITLNDPYNSAFPHTINNSDFERVFSSLTCITSE